MSVLDRLKAIRGRRAVQAEAPDAVSHEPVAPPPAAPFPATSAFPAEDEAPVTAPQPATKPESSTASMWDLAVEPGAADDQPLPESGAGGVTPLRFPPAAADPTPAASSLSADAGWPEDSRWPPHSRVAEAPTAWAPAPEPAPFSSPQSEPAPRRGGRVKTRLLGFDHSSGLSTDLPAPAPAPAAEAPGHVPAVMFPVGWLVVVDGPGRGASFALAAGVSQIGRGEDQAVRLDLGDTTISRVGHAAIAFDDATRDFFIGHGGKSNLVRLNGRPLLSTEPLGHGDQIQIGETTLRLVALCGESFTWADGAGEAGTGSGAR